jgi:cytochrome c553
MIALAVMALLSLPSPASEESVDRKTQAALSLDAHPDRGADLFARRCARCHGTAAQGNAARIIPALAGQRFKYLVRQLADFAGSERESDAMHGVTSQQEMRSPQAWVDVAAYLNAAPMSHRAQTGSGAQVQLGRAIFSVECASCHSADAHGDPEGFVPAMRNQHYSYLMAQLHKLGEGYRHNVDENLVLFIKSLDDEDLSATADYLSRLQGPGAVHRVMRDDGVVVD